MEDGGWGMAEENGNGGWRWMTGVQDRDGVHGGRGRGRKMGMEDWVRKIAMDGGDGE
jgi:hypothetical protein